MIRPILFALVILYVAISSHLLIIPNFDIAILYAAGGLNVLLLIILFVLLIQPSKPEPIEYKNLIDKLPICS